MVFSAMLNQAYTGADPDITLRYRTDGGVFNLRRLQAKTRVQTQPIREFLFADDCALGSSSERAMQDSVGSFGSACDYFCLTISTQKTEVLHQPAPHTNHTMPTIQVNGADLKNCDRCVYLGSTINNVPNIDDEVDLRISKASQSFGRLHSTVWNHRGLK
eukprot:GHVO01064820.1.p1 GENE.GHVO01064820.1~~GHVO01064820.1.p1  ORF type:complete len:160 (-),score=20.43 GHVO01064820.1:279-758(-)